MKPASTTFDYALSTHYGQGIRDGFDITLKLLLGEPAGGGEPYRGPMPDELRAWAKAALDKIEASRV